jgi:hypothetical protein
MNVKQALEAAEMVIWQDGKPADVARAAVLAFLEAVPESTDLAKPGERVRITVKAINTPSRLIAAIKAEDGA